MHTDAGLRAFPPLPPAPPGMEPVAELVRLKPKQLSDLPPELLRDFFFDLGLVLSRGGFQQQCEQKSCCWVATIPFGERVKTAAAPHLTISCSDSKSNAVSSLVAKLTGDPALITDDISASPSSSAVGNTSSDPIRKDITALLLAAVDGDSPLASRPFAEICCQRAVDFGPALTFVQELFAPMRNFLLVIENIASTTAPPRFVLQTTRADLKWATEMNKSGAEAVVLSGGERELWKLLPDAAVVVSAPSKQQQQPPPSQPSPSLAQLAAAEPPPAAAPEKPVAPPKQQQPSAPAPAKPPAVAPAAVVVAPVSPPPSTDSTAAASPSSSSSSMLVIAGAAVGAAALSFVLWKVLSGKKQTCN
jgi:hypothetical protein